MKNIMIKCMNEKCSNYKQELNAGTEICSLCGEKTEQFEIKVNAKLKIAAIFAAIIGLMLFIGAWGTAWYMSMAIVPASAVLGFISRSKAAVIVTNLSLMSFAGLFIYNFIVY